MIEIVNIKTAAVKKNAINLVGVASSLLLLLSPLAVTAQNNFWTSPASQNYNEQSSVSQGEQNLTAHLRNQQDVGVDGRYSQSRAITLAHQLSESSNLSFQYADTLDQRNFTLGFRSNNLSLSVMSGSGEDYSRLQGDYAGIDPYLFHSGYRQNFSTQGSALDYHIGGVGHIQFGQASIDSDGLLSRRARYMEWSNSRAFARMTRFSRANEHIGYGLDAGFAFGPANNTLLAIQAMQLDNNRRMQRLRLQFNGKKSQQYWFDISSHQNPLFMGNDDYRFMFSFKKSLGSKSLASYQNDTVSQNPAEDESGAKKGNGKAWKRAVFIGVGVAAVASMSSSGSPEQDTLVRFRSQRDAAFDVLNGINPSSVRENREYGGWVFINTDGSYASTTPVPGEAASVQLPNPSLVIPAGGRRTATYHTHAAFDPRYDNENFSQTDLDNDRDLNLDGYLGTPGGQFKYHNVATGQVSTLGTIAIE